VIETVAAAVGAIVLATAAGAGFGLLATRGPRGGRRRVPVATIVALVVVGVPTLLQFTAVPSVLDALERDREQIFDGEAWRLATSLVVQDGGIAGTITNLLALALIGVVAEWIWGPARWVLIALGSGLLAQLWGLVVQPVGAGNSVAVYGLAASVAVAALVRGRGPARILGVVSLLGVALLLGVGDLHGGAAAIGAVIGALIVWAERAPEGAGDDAADPPPLS
jgi:hypothetical protein